MTTGQTRREDVQDRLAGHSGVEPITLQGPGLSSPTPIQLPGPSVQSQLSQQIADWGGAKIAERLNKQHEKDMLAGQVAAAQGQTLEQISMAGNKWALEGYRMVEAQTVSSSLLAAQQEEIVSGGYQLSDEQWRAQYVGRLDAALEGVDPNTARLVREQMTAHIPALVTEHTVQRVRWQEGENYAALERGIDVISRDPTATEALVLFARGGEDSPTAGLSDARRQSATVSGVIRAFDNDNPLAYSALVGEGLLGDNLTTDEQNSIKAAQQRFETRRRTEYNEELFTAETDLMDRVEHGELSPSVAVDEMSILYSRHGIQMDMADAGGIYAAAETGQDVTRRTRGLLLEEAGLRGDRETQANIIMDSLIGTESGGNSEAFRTNVDGRSFGGLVQMGQARLDEVTAAMGIPNLTVAQYTAMSPEDQKKIARRHFVDLIIAAEETGAIGAQINGTTVTLSGLVAVAHLGGIGGMRSFVESGGEYNPSDEEGTSLSDYLATHGSGEMQEYMGATEQYDRAVRLRDQTRERVALDAYEQTQPQIDENNAAYIRGDMDREEWRSRNDAIYAEYGRARTEADVRQDVATIKSATEYSMSVAQQGADDQYQLNLEAAKAALSVPQLAWEDVLNNPASTSEQVVAANAEFLEQRGAVFDQYGIQAIDRGDGGAAELMVQRTRTAMDRQRVYKEQQTEIEAAISFGDVANLPKPLQERAFAQMRDNTIKTYTDAVAQGAMSEEAANIAVARDMNAGFAQMGVVDPVVARQMTAAVGGQLIDRDGNPNPRAIDAIAQWAELKAMNPRAADTMLSGEALARAEAVLSRTGGDPALIGEAVRDVGMDVSNKSPLATSTDEFMSRPDVQDGLTAAVDDLLNSQDIGWLHAAWQEDATYDQAWDRGYVATDRMWSEESTTRVRGEIAEELSRLQRQNPGIRASDLVARASENVERRTQVIGGDVVVLPNGQDFNRLLFGSRANEMSHDGAANSAIMTWLRSDATREQYPFITGTTFSENLPGWVQGAVDTVPFVDFKPVMSWTEAGDTQDTGVRPFRTFVAGNNTVAIQVILPDGNPSEPIIVPLAEAGRLYMDQIKGSLTQQ